MRRVTESVASRARSDEAGPRGPPRPVRSSAIPWPHRASAAGGGGEAHSSGRAARGLPDAHGDPRPDGERERRDPGSDPRGTHHAAGRGPPERVASAPRPCFERPPATSTAALAARRVHPDLAPHRGQTTPAGQIRAPIGARVGIGRLAAGSFETEPSPTPGGWNDSISQGGHSSPRASRRRAGVPHAGGEAPQGRAR